MKKDNSLKWILVFSFLMLMASPLISEDFTPVADTFIKCSGTYDNYGGDEYIYVRQVTSTGDEGYNRHGYLKFDISSYAGTIGTALLHLNVLRATGSQDNPIKSHFWLLADADDGWEEMAITWTSAPAKWDSANDVIEWVNTPGTSLFDHTFRVHEQADPDTTYVFDITDAVAADVNGIISIFMADTSRGSAKVYLHAKENTVSSAAAKLEILETVSTDDSESLTPSTFSLHQNYPNPFNPKTRIDYTLDKATDVKITVFNLLGKEVATILSDYVSAGEHSVVWNGTDENNQAVPSGVYYCKMVGNDQSQMIKMVLMK